MEKRVIEVNPEKCTGCRMCEMVCSLNKQGVCSSVFSNIRIVKEDTFAIDLPVVCMQCDDAPCEKVCPVGAIRTENGILTINHDLCIGCRACSVACPIGAISYFAEENQRVVAHKCDLCKDEDEPVCVKFCPADALKVVRSEDTGRYKQFEFLNKFRIAKAE